MIPSVHECVPDLMGMCICAAGSRCLRVYIPNVGSCLIYSLVYDLRIQSAVKRKEKKKGNTRRYGFEGTQFSRLDWK